MPACPLFVALLLAPPAFAEDAPRLAGVEVSLPSETTVLGARLKGTTPAARLAGRLDDIPYPKALALLKLADVGGADAAIWQAEAETAVWEALPADVRAPSLTVLLQVTEVAVLVDEAGAAAQLVLQWALVDSWGQRLAMGRAEGDAVVDADDAPGAVRAALRQAVSRTAEAASFTRVLSEDAGPPPTALAVEGPLHLPTCATPVGDVAGVIRATVVVRTQAGVGAGVRISPQGHVVTAYHVVHGAKELTVRSDGGQPMDATVVRVVPELDLALLAHEGSGDCVAPAGQAVVGSDLFAVGTPAGEALAFSVSRGIVSGLRPVAGGVALVQTDASINRGNSGGPLVDAQGRWVGVVSFKLMGVGAEGLAFGLPAAAAVDALGIAFDP